MSFSVFFKNPFSFLFGYIICLNNFQVLRLPLKDGKIDAENISELFYDHGDLISGSSVATVYNSKLLIGSVFHKLVICDVNINM